MLKVNACDLDGAALEWAVAIANEGGIADNEFEFVNWVVILEREKISIRPAILKGWHATCESSNVSVWSDTLEKAIMRCYVAVKLGCEIQVPLSLVA